MYCTLLGKILICGKCALGRRRSQAVWACSVGYCHFPPPSLLYIYIFTPSYAWPLKRCRMEGSFCWGLIINWPEVTSYHRGPLNIIKGFKALLPGYCKWTDDEANQHNKRGERGQCIKSALNQANIIKMILYCGLFWCPILKFIDVLSMWLERRFYKDELIHSNPLMIKPILIL